MTGYVILAVFIGFAVLCFAAFLAGIKNGRKAAAAEYAEEQARKEKDRRDYERAAREIKQEVFHDAEQEKASLAGHTGARDRFDAINSKLSDRPKN
jgi:flagellar biosynthesis/type III secretory pathway M-ring protein FliF/YscJ